MDHFELTRDYLIDVFEDTCERIKQSEQLSSAVKASCAIQQFIPEDQTVELPNPRFDQPAKVHITRNRSFEAAIGYARGTDKVAVLNFASATTPGGGVESGSRAQEESLCRVSTLFQCLSTDEMEAKFYTPHINAHNSLHNDDIIYTPDVVVLKDDNYQMLEQPYKLDIITCAAPNLREHPSNRYNFGEGKRQIVSPEELQAIHEKRGRKIISVAAQHGVDVLILGAFGCGAFRNDPAVVAKAYKNILPEFLHYFKEIEFAVYCGPTGPDRNYFEFDKRLG